MIRIYLVIICLLACSCATTKDVNQQGIALANEKQYQQALQKFLEAHEEQPDRFETCLNVAQMYIVLKDTKQAIVYIDKALDLNAQLLDIHLLKMQVLFIRGEKTQALEILDALTKEHGDSPRLYALLLSMGDEALKQKKWEDSYKWYQKAIDINPQQSKGYIALSRALIFKGSDNEQSYGSFVTSINNRNEQFNKAKSTLRKAVYVNNNDFDAHLMLAMIAMQMKDYSEAQIEFAEALRIEPNNIIALTSSSFNENQMGNISKSMEYLKRAKQLYPERVEPLFLEANLFIQRNKFSQAILVYVDIWTKHPQLRNNVMQNFQVNINSYFSWMVQLLNHNNQKIANFSLDILKEITKQDFARDTAKWQMWYKEKGKYENQKN